MEEVKKAGTNCLLSSFDVKDAFKNCRMAKSELWQQIYKVQKKFYIDLGGTFGSRNAGDAWNRVMEVLIRSARKHSNIQRIFCYVDNFIIITPPLDGKPDYVLAQGLPFLKAPLGWLHRKIANYKALSTEGLDDLKDRFIHYIEYVQKLLEDWKGSASIHATSTTQPDMTIYSDASGSKGFGYLDLNSLQYGFGKWSQKDLKQAHRESKTSSTFLEILAIGLAIKSLGKKNTAVEIICDSQPAVFALERRYYKGAIDGQNIIIGLDKFCRDTGIATFYKHQPREDPNIKLVDALSKGTIPEGLKINGTLTKNRRVEVYSEECA